MPDERTPHCFGQLLEFRFWARITNAKFRASYLMRRRFAAVRADVDVTGGGAGADAKSLGPYIGSGSIVSASHAVGTFTTPFAAKF